MADTHEYKVRFFNEMLHDEVYRYLRENHKEVIDGWRTGRMNGFKDEDFVYEGCRVRVSTRTMRTVLKEVSEYFPEVYDRLVEVIDFTEEYFTEVGAREEPVMLERLDGVLAEWRKVRSVFV